MLTLKNVLPPIIVLFLFANVGSPSGFETSNLPLNLTQRNDRKLSDAQWSSDLDALALLLCTRHPHPYWKTSKDVFDQHIAHIKTQIPLWSDSQIIVELMKLVALVGDGHTQLLGDKLTSKWFPIRIESFADGWFITSTSTKYLQSYGARVLKIGNTAIEEVTNRVKAVVPADNEWGAKYLSPKYLMMFSVMQTLGYVDQKGLLELEIVAKNGMRGNLKVLAEPYQSQDAFSDMVAAWFWRKNAVPAVNYVNVINDNTGSLPLLFQNYEKPYWFKYIPERKAVYLGFNECQNDGTVNFETFSLRMWKQLENENADKLIIDLRNNLGGTTDILKPLLHGIIRHERINRRGHLFVLIGRKTFSAALQCAVWIENECEVLFVGEPTGAPPNHHADPNIETLAQSGIKVMVSRLYWQKSAPNDRRPWLAPQIPVDQLSTDYFSHQDRGIQAVWSFQESVPGSREPGGKVGSIK